MDTHGYDRLERAWRAAPWTSLFAGVPCLGFGPPTTWLSDNTTRFRNRVMRKLAKALGVEHRLSVASSAWTNGTVERMMREVIHVAKAMLNEGWRPLSEWVVLLPTVQWTLNTAWRKRLQTSPYHVMMGRKPRTAYAALIEEDDDEGFQCSPQSTKTGCNSWWFLWWTPRRSSWQGCCNASMPIVVTTEHAAVAARCCRVSR